MDAESARRRARELSRLNAFISLSEEQGSPAVAVKDLVDVRGTVTTGGGVILPDVPAERDAPVIERIRESGAAVMGKASLHEWAYGATSDNPHYGPVRNPHDEERVAGGSSGGSAVAVATGMCDWALGSDTGGSIRIPAGFCGVVGFKPTLGTADTEGVIPLSRTLDTLGPLARDVAGAARALESMSELTDLVPEAVPDLASLRLGVPRGWVEALDETTELVWQRVAEGIPEVDFLDRRSMHDAGVTILLTEALAYHRRWFTEQPEKYGEDVRALLRSGEDVPRSEYVVALLAMAQVRTEAEAAMERLGVDALLVPVAPFVAPRIGEQAPRGRLLAYTRPFNVSGQPVISLPAPAPGLPVGIQVVGRAGRERDLVAVAMALEAAWQAPA
ncbi:MAG TPA: amidase [Candidatus Dormibacteraeota bacterium]